ncbi:MAG: bifunctional 2-polyprenyl-6-hydroxyphenol methylase/3-demethylubiquinol 3-O-methyltransferase UbiG [Rhizobiales bacterium]|nr:bifunctional 2-polyprenyl-6-hydroxyphenol methylase/3-demethylubiquinol 3-O-methyltransferase UbiG [Hyphomicrobiales bacterium]
MAQETKSTTIDPDDVANFVKIAEQWWDPKGKFAPLHKFNPIRLKYIREKLFEHFALEQSAAPYKGLRILDIGCGGGLLTEPISRLGADIIGADAAEKNIKIASAHAMDQGLEIDYRATTSEELAEAGEQFDVILNMEVIEHVANVPLFLSSCHQMLKPGGIMFIATLNRNLKSFAFAIIGVEYVLGWLPKGTHNWSKFIIPAELQAMNEALGLTMVDETGVKYNPLSDKFSLNRDKSINYIQLYKKDA